MLIQMLKESLQREPASVPARTELAKLFRDRGELRAALAETRQVAQQMPNFFPAQQMLYEIAFAVEAQELSFTGNRPFTISVAAARECMRLAPDRYVSHVNVGVVHYNRRDWSAAEACYTRAIELARKVRPGENPPIGVYQHVVASCRLHQGDLEGARKCLADLAPPPAALKPDHARLVKKIRLELALALERAQEKKK
ncbi:MAG: tetratricopeptide repeat protein [Candidatus Riflebacteria bacterium]|nr:tetratricopeptide repeat protein [Candidatus Riflebacteria bacterium]